MAKNFNFAAFIANFGRIINSHIKKEGAKWVATDLSNSDLLSDQGSFYCAILNIVKFGDEIAEIQTSCKTLFERNLDIISKDISYISDCQRFEKEGFDMQELIENQSENALEYERAARPPKVFSGTENSGAAATPHLISEFDLSVANSNVDLDDYGISHTAYILGRIEN